MHSKLLKGFIKPAFSYRLISGKRLYAGIFAGAGFALAMHLLLMASRLAFVFVPAMTSRIYVNFTADEMFAGTLFFAAISAVTGLSICLEIWFNDPMMNLARHRRITIVNDQRNLTWSFWNWFSRVAALFAAMLGLFGPYISLTESHYSWVFMLIPPVLFLNLWLNIRLAFKGISRLFFPSVGAVMFLAFLLSMVPGFESEKISERTKPPHMALGLDLPESFVVDRIEKMSLMIPVYFSDGMWYLEDTNGKLENNELSVALNELVIRAGRIQSFLTVVLFADEQEKMEKIKLIVNEFRRAGITKVIFASKNIGEKDPITTFYSGIALSLPPIHQFIEAPYGYLGDSISNVPPPIAFRFFKHDLLEIHITESGNIELKEHKYTPTKLFGHLENLLSDSNFVIDLKPEKSASYGSYVLTISAVFKAYQERRNQLSLDVYSKPFVDLDASEKSAVIDSLPIKIFDPSYEMREYLENNNDE